MSATLRLIMDAPWRMAAPTLLVRGTARVREAVRIRLRDADGTVGLGEALPLPGYSLDDAGAAERALGAIAARAAVDGGLAVPDADGGARRAAAWLSAAIAPYAALLDAAPSARFALECALVDLLARRERVSAAQLAGRRPCAAQGAGQRAVARRRARRHCGRGRSHSPPPRRAEAEDCAIRSHAAARG